VTNRVWKEGMPESHVQGSVSIENLDRHLEKGASQECDFGIRIGKDGRVWICINGVSIIRFTPSGPRRKRRREETEPNENSADLR